MRVPLTKKTKLKLKGQLNSIRKWYIRKRYAFNTDQFIALLRELGLREGDVVLVHSSFGAFQGFVGQPVDIISTLQKCVGEKGILLMPTMPFAGTALDYVRQGKPLNVRRTPSRMGLLTELFRRMPTVVRSVHPTHPVAAWGGLAETITADHEKCETPCGRHSPFGRLLDYNGRILFLGTGIGVLTFLHTVEEIMKDELPFPVFTEETFHLASTNASGVEVKTQTLLYDPAVSRKRNPFKLIPELKKRGKWKQARLGCLDVILLEAKDVLDTLQEMAKDGKYCYNDIA